MKIKFRQLLFELLIWLTTELFLGCVGLDNLADYSEYLKEQDTTWKIFSDRRSFVLAAPTYFKLLSYSR
ncbi:MAG: hypothetical protein ACTS3T_03125 [Almyronema sp.]